MCACKHHFKRYDLFRTIMNQDTPCECTICYELCRMDKKNFQRIKRIMWFPYIFLLFGSQRLLIDIMPSSFLALLISSVGSTILYLVSLVFCTQRFVRFNGVK